MRSLVALVGFGLIALSSPLPQGSLDDFIEMEMSASGVPGVAYAVVVDGEVTWVGAHGVVDLEDGREVTADTPFLTGSISKSFTALAVMQLVEAGKVGLDDELSLHLPEFSGRSAGAATVRQLLSHTSGFSTLQGNDSHGDGAGGSEELERRVDSLAKVAATHQPGARWEYSNANYLILGRLIEVISGQDFQGYVTAKILEPVGMEHSFVSDGATHEPMATGHRPWFGSKRPLADDTTSRGMAPAGGIVASAEDLARYLVILMNGEDDVLSAHGKLLMMSPASDASPFYGFGWYVDSDDGTVSHSGLSPGFESLATVLPSEQKAVVVLVNANSGIGFGETAELLNGITARVLGVDYAGEGSHWSQKALFLSLVLLPVVYLLSMVWAWRRREGIRAKSGASGLFSLWFPLLTTLIAAWFILWMVPISTGAPLGTLALFQPDLGLALIATAAFGVLWALFRLGVAYTGGPVDPK